jgi:hypothetical protein
MQNAFPDASFEVDESFLDKIFLLLAPTHRRSFFLLFESLMTANSAKEIAGLKI